MDGESCMSGPRGSDTGCEACGSDRDDRLPPAGRRGNVPGPLDPPSRGGGFFRLAHHVRRLTSVALLVALSAACAQPKPVLYPNAHLQRVGPEAAEQDIEECQAVAKAAGSRSRGGKTGEVAGSTAVGAGVGAASGAAGGAVVGAAGSGSAIGAVSGAVAGLLRGLFRPSRPSSAYTGIVDRCLRERGYEPMGWE